jgi:drug/metabolite transporter (DMT)-like permease
VSRVIPVVYTHPIFVAILAAPLLGETLSHLQWLAIIIVVAGAIVVSSRNNLRGLFTGASKPLLLLFSASLLYAAADISSKYALGHLSFWNLFWVTAFFMSTLFIASSLRPRIIRQLAGMEQRNSTLGLILFNEILAPTAIVFSFLAMARGPVSLVSTLTSSRPIFVVIYALILSRLAPSFLESQSGRGRLIVRLAATVMIVGGIAIIYLT